MTSHNPAGYYGLKLRADLENEVNSLDKADLELLLLDLAAYLNRDDEEFGFESAYASVELDTYIEDLKYSDLIAFIRWVAEILAVKANGQP